MAFATILQLRHASPTLLLACLTAPAFVETIQAFTEKSLGEQGAQFSHHNVRYQQTYHGIPITGCFYFFAYPATFVGKLTRPDH